jgi:hypothetical protein
MEDTYSNFELHRSAHNICCADLGIFSPKREFMRRKGNWNLAGVYTPGALGFYLKSDRRAKPKAKVKVKVKFSVFLCVEGAVQSAGYYHTSGTIISNVRTKLNHYSCYDSSTVEPRCTMEDVLFFL